MTRPALRWKKDWRRFQPMMPSHDSTWRRRTSEPVTLTSPPPTTACPRPR
ncbi:MAG TPA: hypothetical protein VE664_03705 [Actinomycetes bacterium]|nr:hypothetical protein [Actinomycetes bacterium]